MSRWERMARTESEMSDEMGSTDAIVDRLDELILLIRAAFDEQIRDYRDALLADPLTEVILDLLGGETVASGEIQRAAAAAAGVSERTVQRALVRLVERRVIRVNGKGSATTYRSAGIL